MSVAFLGFHHLDVRVTSLAAVEAFYDALLPSLGLVARTTSVVDPDGTWRTAAPHERYNVVEYGESSPPGGLSCFIGIIEDPAMRPVKTRIAFSVASLDELVAWAPRLVEIGARAVELNDDLAGYPALFFEDPAGTCLEFCARPSRGA